MFLHYMCYQICFYSVYHCHWRGNCHIHTRNYIYGWINKHESLVYLLLPIPNLSCNHPIACSGKPNLVKEMYVYLLLCSYRVNNWSWVLTTYCTWKQRKWMRKYTHCAYYVDAKWVCTYLYRQYVCNNQLTVSVYCSVYFVLHRV